MRGIDSLIKGEASHAGQASSRGTTLESRAIRTSQLGKREAFHQIKNIFNYQDEMKCFVSSSPIKQIFRRTAAFQSSVIRFIPSCAKNYGVRSTGIRAFSSTMSATTGTVRAELIRDLGGQKHSTLKKFSLDGNVAVITGGAQGLGLAMAQALFTSGADLAIIDLDRKAT